MKRRLFIILFICVVLMNTHITASGYENIVERDHFSLGRISQILKDPAGEITFEEILTREHEDSFKDHELDVFHFGLTKDVHWIRFDIMDIEEELMPERWNEYLLYFDYSGIEKIELYLPVLNEQEENYVQFLGGFFHSGLQDETGFIFPVFQLPENFDPERPVYSRVESIYSKNFALGIAERNSFSGTQQLMVLALSLVYGIMLAMMLYNLVLFFAMKDKTYIYYVGYILFMTIYQVGVTGMFKIINFEWGEVLELYTLAATFTAIIFALLFAWSFINVPRFVPKAKYLAYVFIVACGTGILLVLSGRYFYANRLAYLIGATLPFLIMITAITAYRKGQVISRYYIIATAVLFSTVIVYVLRGIGMLEHNFITSHAVTVSAGMESLLLSFALADRIRMLRKHREQADKRTLELTKISITDSLTGLFNRRYFDDILADAKEKAVERNTPVSLIYLDIDHFKKFNDTYGHLKGDQVLQALAKVIRNNIREGDYPCRIGGEEFAVIFSDTNLTRASEIAERIRTAFETVNFRKIAPEISTVTVSIGVAELNNEEPAEDWVNRADKALYKAKKEGRNRVVK